MDRTQFLRVKRYGAMLDDVAETALHLSEHAPNARAVLLPDVAHMIAMERPAELAALVTEFLDPLRPWS